MTVSRRSVIAGGLAAPFALPFALPSVSAAAAPAGSALADPDLWVRLCAERRMLYELAENSVVAGNIPVEIEDICWPRVFEIDAEIAASQPASPRGLKAAMTEYLREIDGSTICDEDLLRSLFGAALALAEKVSS